MAEFVVMEKDAAQMNVPVAKLAKFQADGWKEIRRYSVEAEPAPVVEETPPAPAPIAEPAHPKGRKAKAKS